jgi:putative NADPH-quinone reductase
VQVLLVDGFAEPHASVSAAVAALRAGGHEVTVLGLIEAGFDRFMSPEERRAYHEADNLVTPEQRASAELVRGHDALLVCGPLVEGTIAPCVKSWFERVFIPEVSFTFTKSGRVTGALKNIRRIGMIVDCPGPDRWAHRRRSSTRSVVRAVRMNAARTCRSTYVALLPGDDVDARVRGALARW